MKNIVVLIGFCFLFSCTNNQDTDKQTKQTQSSISHDLMHHIDVVIVKMDENVAPGQDKFHNPSAYNSALVHVVQYPEYYGVVRLSDELYYNSLPGDTLFLPEISRHYFFKLDTTKRLKPNRKILNTNQYSSILY